MSTLWYVVGTVILLFLIFWKLFLPNYADWWFTVKIYNQFIFVDNKLWRTPIQTQIDFYNHNITQNGRHLEIGCTSVYQPLHSKLNRKIAKIHLLDIKKSALVTAKKTLVQNGFIPNNVTAAHCDVLSGQKIKNVIGEEITFNSIGMSWVLHCIPSPMPFKLDRVIQNLLCFMDEKTVFFGFTICNIYKEFMINDIPWHVQRYHDCLVSAKIFFNIDDVHQDIEKVLNHYFKQYNVKQIGFGFMFSGTGIKSKLT